MKNLGRSGLPVTLFSKKRLDLPKKTLSLSSLYVKITLLVSMERNEFAMGTIRLEARHSCGVHSAAKQRPRAVLCGIVWAQGLSKYDINSISIVSNASLLRSISLSLSPPTYTNYVVESMIFDHTLCLRVEGEFRSWWCGWTAQKVYRQSRPGRQPQLSPSERNRKFSKN